jgi:hypothetical protein
VGEEVADVVQQLGASPALGNKKTSSYGRLRRQMLGTGGNRLVTEGEVSYQSDWAFQGGWRQGSGFKWRCLDMTA